MRIGLHTGTVLAGIVGIAMPRYCLFGNSVTLANKFESNSEALKTNVSPTTFELLTKSSKFQFTARGRDTLSDEFPKEVPGTCHFPLGYTPDYTNMVVKQLFRGKEHGRPPP